MSRIVKYATGYKVIHGIDDLLEVNGLGKLSTKTPKYKDIFGIKEKKAKKAAGELIKDLFALIADDIFDKLNQFNLPLLYKHSIWHLYVRMEDDVMGLNTFGRKAYCALESNDMFNKFVVKQDVKWNAVIRKNLMNGLCYLSEVRIPVNHKKQSLKEKNAHL